MSAGLSRRRMRKQGTDANPHRHSNPPSREQLRHENERLLRENEDLRRKLADAEKRIADAEKQIADAEKQVADLERQLAARQKNSTNSSKPPSSDGLAGKSRPRGGVRRASANRVDRKVIPAITARWLLPNRSRKCVRCYR